MTRTSLKSTTAILAAMSLLQPLPSLAQANINANEAGAEAQAESAENTGALSTAGTATGELGEDAAAAARVDVDAKSAADAEAETQAEIEAAEQAEEDAAVARADAQAVAAEDAQAEADTEAETQAEAEAAKQAEEDAAAARADAQAVAAEDAQAEADTEAEAQAEAVAAEQAEEDAAEEDEARAEADATETEQAEDDTSAIETLTGAPLDALAADADADTPVDVTTETVTEETSRASDEEFDEWSPENQDAAAAQQNAAPRAQSDSGMSDLQQAGLLALGAAVVGGILLNGQRVEANTGDRVIVVDDDNDYRILKDDDALLRQPGSDVRTQRFSDGSTRTNVMRSDGTEIVTIRDSGGRVLRRVLIETDGDEYVLFDDTQNFAPVEVRNLPEPSTDTFDYQVASDGDGLRAALLAADQRDIGRSFSLQQVREINEVRQLSPEINLRNVTFTTDSAAIQPSQAKQLRQMGLLMRDVIAEDPTELFLIEGYTDAIGEPGCNLLLSDRRAESVALAFNEYFDVPAENMVVQGYGERFLKISTQQAERVNRRVAVRRITTLMRDSGR